MHLGCCSMLLITVQVTSYARDHQTLHQHALLSRAQRRVYRRAGPSEQISIDHEAAHTTGRQQKVQSFSGHTLTVPAPEVSTGHQSSCAAGQRHSNPALTRRQRLNAALAAKARQQQHSDRALAVTVPPGAVVAVPSEQRHQRGLSSRPAAAFRCACMIRQQGTAAHSSSTQQRKTDCREDMEGAAPCAGPQRPLLSPVVSSTKGRSQEACIAPQVCGSVQKASG